MSDPIQSINVLISQLYDQVAVFWINMMDAGSYLATAMKVFNILLFVFAIFFMFVIAYSFIRILEIRKREHHHLHHEIEEYRHKHAHDNEKINEVSSNKQWVNVLKLLISPNASDWKLSVMEADNMLDAVMTELGFKGDGLGEKLKSTDQEKFKFLPLAWEVHIIRNRIAHEGESFLLSQVEARRVISIYEQIFRTYGFI